jgi:hypothetical protein
VGVKVEHQDTFHPEAERFPRRGGEAVERAEPDPFVSAGVVLA